LIKVLDVVPWPPQGTLNLKLTARPAKVRAVGRKKATRMRKAA